jgi:hypothetical protein
LQLDSTFITGLKAEINNMLFLLLMLIEVFSFAIKLIKPIANEILYIGIEDAKVYAFGSITAP